MSKIIFIIMIILGSVLVGLDVVGKIVLHDSHYMLIALLIGVTAVYLGMSLSLRLSNAVSVAGILMIGLIAIAPAISIGLNSMPLFNNAKTGGNVESGDVEEGGAGVSPSVIADCTSETSQDSAINFVNGEFKEASIIAIPQTERIVRCYNLKLEHDSVIVLDAFVADRDNSDQPTTTDSRLDPYLIILRPGTDGYPPEHIIADDDGGFGRYGSKIRTHLTKGDYLVEFGLTGAPGPDPLYFSAVNWTPGGGKVEVRPMVIDADPEMMELSTPSGFVWLQIDTDSLAENEIAERCLSLRVKAPTNSGHAARKMIQIIGFSATDLDGQWIPDGNPIGGGNNANSPDQPAKWALKMSQIVEKSDGVLLVSVSFLEVNTTGSLKIQANTVPVDENGECINKGSI